MRASNMATEKKIGFSFGKRSLANLDTCHERIQTVLYEAIKIIDFSVLCGHRTKEDQFELYKQGRILINGHWEVQDGKKIVTQKDGYKKESVHQTIPSEAVDVAPWPIDWDDINRFKVLSNVIKYVANKFKIKIIWGGDWKRFPDYPHYQLEE